MCSNDLSLGFNAGAAHPNHHHHPMWHPLPSTTSFHPYPDPNSLFTPSSSAAADAASHSINVGLIPLLASAPAATTHVKGTWVPAGGGATVACQDCGNQAKKDCGHARCRTCCRNRGFDCSTHVRSTWVSAARRREQQVTVGGGGAASSGSSSGAKKPRTVASQNTTAATTSHTSASNTPARSFDTSSSHQDAGFKETLPGQVRAPAVFKCVRVMAVDDGEDEFAYQAVVKIGGHVFKGFLYDQGADQSRVDRFLNLSELHLGGGGGGCDGRVGRNGASSSSSLLDPSVVYGGSGGLLGGSSYGNTLS